MALATGGLVPHKKLGRFWTLKVFFLIMDLSSQLRGATGFSFQQKGMLFYKTNFKNIVELSIKFNYCFKKNWAILGLFFFIFVFSIQLSVNVQYKFADDWIPTADLPSWKPLLYQLRHTYNCKLRLWKCTPLAL